MNYPTTFLALSDGDEDTLRPRTFRVQQIPRSTTAEQLKEYFDPEDRPRIGVKSIVPAVRNHNSAGELTATLTFQACDSLKRCPRLLDDKLNIDSDFYGFTPLNHPEGSIVADIIAVTGLAGHAYGSWAHSDQKMWLRDYLPKDVPNARVLTYGYPSQLQGNMSRSILSDYSDSFARQLLDMRASARCQDRPIIFIGHSLGCLIIKKALIDFDGSDHPHCSHLPVPLIIFLAAPHKGLQTNALETLVKSKPTEDLIRELKPGSPTLTDLNRRFAIVAKDIEILTCYELYPTKTAIQMDDGSWKREAEPQLMVQPDHAKLFWFLEKRMPAYFDHSQIAKLKEGEGSIYPTISWSIKSAVEQQIISDHSTSKDSARIYYNNLESDPDRSFGGAGASTSDKGKKSSAAAAAKPPNTKSPKQLCAAIRDGNTRKVQEILARRGCSVHPVNVENDFMPPGAYLYEGKDPYLLAAFLRQEMTLKLLLEHGADPSQTDPIKMTALHAVICGEGRSMDPPTESIVALLLHHQNPLEQGDILGMTPLMHIVSYGYLTLTKMLLNRGANVHARDKRQLTTMHHAVFGKNPDIVALLISKGAEINAGTPCSMVETALHSACRDSSSTSAQIVKMLLDAGADKDEFDDYLGESRTPLHLAAMSGNVDVISVLLSSKANIEAQNRKGWRAIHYAFLYGHTLAFRTLLDHGARVSEYTEFLDPTGKGYGFASRVSTKNKEHCVLLLETAMEEQQQEYNPNTSASNCLGRRSHRARNYGAMDPHNRLVIQAWIQLSMSRSGTESPSGRLQHDSFRPLHGERISFLESLFATVSVAQGETAHPFRTEWRKIADMGLSLPGNSIGP